MSAIRGISAKTNPLRYPCLERIRKEMVALIRRPRRLLQRFRAERGGRKGADEDVR
jgi:hypothetical protein